MNYIIIYTNDRYCPVIEAYVEEGKWWNALEEALYIHFELTPKNRYWRQELACFEDVTFTYGNTEFFTLHRLNHNTFSIYF